VRRSLVASGFSTASQMNKIGKGILIRAGNPCLSLELWLDSDNIRAASSADGVPATIWDDRQYVTEDGP
jgi:hypothetical protein